MISSEASPETEGIFDETTYLAIHSDVMDAVKAGIFASGRAHYDAFGKTERRILNFSETRKSRLLAGLDVANNSGIEIGALDKPIVAKDEGDVFYVDYADTVYLRNRYRDDENVVIDNIVQVDGVWGEKTLAEAVGSDGRFDYVLASHVVEHVPDLVSWLREICAVLVDSGAVRLVVPDRRYTFDYARRESSIADVLDAYIRKARTPLPRQILDYCLNAREVDALEAWRGPLDIALLKRAFSNAGALHLAIDAFESRTYHDVHCWVFTPTSFVSLMHDVVELGLIDLRCEAISETRPHQIEFIVAMRVETDREVALASWRNPVFV